MSAKAPLDVLAAVIWSGGRYLITTRPDGKHLAGQWEFPGGKRRPDESPAEGLKREIREELGVEALPLDLLASVRHDYPDKSVVIRFYRALVLPGSEDRLHPREGQRFAWVRPEDLAAYDFVQADRPLVERLAVGAGA